MARRKLPNLSLALAAPSENDQPATILLIFTRV